MKRKLFILSSGRAAALFIILAFFSRSEVSAHATEKSSPFVAVFIDEKTEKDMGPFPYERSQTAKAMRALRQAGAKAVVIKFFLDQSKPGPGDDELAAEIKKIPTLLQARMDPNEPNPNALSKRFSYSSQVKGDIRKLLSGESGWIPLEKFSKNAATVGFVDIAREEDIFSIPLVERFQNLVVPSLQLATLDFLFGKRSTITLGHNAKIGNKTLPINAAGEATYELPAKDQIDSISFVDLLKGNFDRKRIAEKIVVLGFDGASAPTMPTKFGPLRVHRLFYFSLLSLHSRL